MFEHSESHDGSLVAGRESLDSPAESIGVLQEPNDSLEQPLDESLWQPLDDSLEQPLDDLLELSLNDWLEQPLES